MVELSGNAKIVAEKRYFWENENWEILSRRVGKAIAFNEKDQDKWGDIFAEDIYNMNFIPGGRILRNSGKLRQCLLNCAALPIGDSIEEIGETLKNALILWSYGAGIGIDFSPLREKGRSLYSKGGESSGMLSFLFAFDHIAHTIETGGQRRSGCLGLCSVRHPQIYEFIDAKKKGGDLSYFNLSIGITEDFLKAVEDDNDWDLTFAGQTVRTIKARNLWDKILESNINNAEPGIINMSNLTKNNSYYFQTTNIVNLCQPDWTPILSKDGLTTLKNINIGDTIWSEDDGWVTVTRKIKRRIDKVYRYRTNSSVFYGTADHPIISNGREIDVDLAESMDSSIGYFDSNIKINPKIVMDGLALGSDFGYNIYNDSVYLYISTNDYDYLNSEIGSLLFKHRSGINKVYKAKTSIVHKELLYRAVPYRYKYADRNTIASFLRGLYTANGSIEDDYRIQLASSSLQLIEDVQVMLSSLGIKSYITNARKKSYIININRDKDKFYHIIGFIQKYKNNRLKEALSKKSTWESDDDDIKTYDIVDKAFISEEEVYSITVDGKSHTYWSGGCNVLNCSEIPLPSYGTCALTSLVLPNFLIGKNNTNWKKLEATIYNAIRFLDNVLDVNFYPLKQTEITTKDGRRIGLGVMGLHDYLMAKEIRYGSEKSLTELEKLYKFIRDTAYKASIQLAIEKGAFPKFSKTDYCNASFVRKLPAKLRMEIKEHGIRNVCMLCAPPSGTTSLLADVSSGIEPVFSLAYKRKDRVSERFYIHPKLKDFIESGSKEKPDWLVDISDLNPEDHLEVQSCIAKFIDNGISKTINCPSDTKKDDLSKLLLEFIYDLKGVTVYVDGSRDNQILNRIDMDDIKDVLENDNISTSGDEDTQHCKLGVCDM